MAAVHPAASAATPDPVSPDFGARARDYAAGRRGFPPAFFERLAAAGLAAPGEWALDLGTGTGTLAIGLARLGLRVTGLDLSGALVAQARLAAAAAGATASMELPIDFVEARAEATGLPAGAFDLVTAGQCWHWFDRPRAAAEVARLLRPGGRLVVAHLDWLLSPGGIAERTLAVVDRFGTWPAVAGVGQHGLYPIWLHELGRSGFSGLESFSFDVDLVYPPRDWLLRLHASAALCALDDAALSRFDAECIAALAGEPEPYRVPHRVFAAVARWDGAWSGSPSE